MAKQIVIVGDHEQVTPLGVGKDQGALENLRRSILQDIPNGHLYDNLSSIYDIARQSFGDAIRLAEHFRCVPEIIAFSNQLSYEGSIRPLRETNSTNLKPACIPYRVHGVRENMTNAAEAETIVSFIEAMIKHPAYAGKTIGVISMVGEAQAVKIETLLHKRIESVEIQGRRIQAGNSAQFQGDERDVSSCPSLIIRMKVISCGPWGMVLSSRRRNASMLRPVEPGTNCGQCTPSTRTGT